MLGFVSWLVLGLHAGICADAAGKFGTRNLNASFRVHTRGCDRYVDHDDFGYVGHSVRNVFGAPLETVAPSV